MISKTAKIGNRVVLGKDVVSGNKTNIGHDANIGNRVIIGHDANIGNGVIIGELAIISDYASISQYANIGKHAVIGQYANVGNEAVIGNWETFLADLGVGIAGFRRTLCWHPKKGLRFNAGCQRLSLADARLRWHDRPDTLACIDYAEKIAPLMIAQWKQYGLYF